MRRGGAIHDQAYVALRDLRVSYARLQPWFPYPKLSMAELDRPTSEHTSWDFSLIDPIVLDFYAAAEGRPIVLNFDIPGWLFKGQPPSYPDDPNEIDWRYQFGPNVSKELRDPTYREVADYYQRVAKWYIRGGFTDELGKVHHSGHHLKIDYWEVLNEQDEGIAHELDPQAYTDLYDTVVPELREVDRQMKFSALALSDATNLHYFEYFLNPKNHKPGIPLDMVSYHDYITARTGHTPAEWQEEMFKDADDFLVTVRKIERIRQRLSPSTKTAINEFGFYWGPENDKIDIALKTDRSDMSEPTIPDEFWSLAASAFAYTFVGVARAGVDLLGAGELVDYPSQLAGSNLIHWQTGRPNAVYRVVKLLHDEFPPGVELVQTNVSGSGVEAQGFREKQRTKLLLVNKTASEIRVQVIPTSGAAATTTVDLYTGASPAREQRLQDNELSLGPHGVMIVSWGVQPDYR
jgi:hypothetical protein